MTNDEILQLVIEFADKAHGDQLRKYDGKRYIVHPIRVMETCKRFTNKIYNLVAAILHDVLEDTETTEGQIREFLLSLLSVTDTELAIQRIKDLTDEYTKEKYPHLNRKKRKLLEAERLGQCQPDSQTIKYADIVDNTEDITTNDPDFSITYIPECEDLLNHMNDGSGILKQIAMDGIKLGKQKVAEFLIQKQIAKERAQKFYSLEKKEMSREELIEKLSSIENVVKEYNGQQRRYYKMKTPASDWEGVIREAATVLFPDMQVEDPEVVELIVEFYAPDRKIEICEDGSAWVRTILV